MRQTQYILVGMYEDEDEDEDVAGSKYKNAKEQKTKKSKHKCEEVYIYKLVIF